MKLQKWIAALFGILFAGFLTATAFLAISGREAPPLLIGSADAAQSRTEVLADALCAGDYAAVSGCLAGQPELAVGDAETVLSQIVWDSYVDSLSCSFSGDCYADGNGLSRDLTVTHLDIPAVLDSLEERAQILRTQSEAETGSSSDEDFVMKLLAEAAKQVLEEEDPQVRKELTLHLTFREGQWWIQPDNALMDILSGGMGGA